MFFSEKQNSKQQQNMQYFKWLSLIKQKHTCVLYLKTYIYMNILLEKILK